MAILNTAATIKYGEIHMDSNGYGGHYLNHEKLPFTDKASYLEWRSVWRAAYADLSVHIRALKPLRKTKRDTYDWSAQTACANLRQKAHRMMDQRHASKIKAASLYTKVKRVNENDRVDAIAYAMAGSVTA